MAARTNGARDPRAAKNRKFVNQWAPSSPRFHSRGATRGRRGKRNLVDTSTRRRRGPLPPAAPIRSVSGLICPREGGASVEQNYRDHPLFGIDEIRDRSEIIAWARMNDD